MNRNAHPHSSDDIAVWPDGTWATLGEVRAGDSAHMSDDYEIVSYLDHARLKALGVEQDPDIGPG
ncbi:hypothetical protein F9288_12875 [Sphingomonas sp. CL5.1]|uniref:hypothetical protein n=1 Tax=Sphingomonas sp. CL5.1 TaxID=2653203 RepID=UPI00158256DB|nr:hypothetical protein [Sphingomonas sp. CL5.1]QKS00416.1 hypothetical protein F9288_12875 [Sphingomonas sp. CL5.1]